MRDEYDSEYQRLLKYVDSACSLADAVSEDIKKGKKYTDKTILALSKFIAEHNSFDKLVDQIRSTNVKLN